MKTIRLLLLDANIVLELHRLKLWSGVTGRCEVLLARTVLDESQFFEDDCGSQQGIKLGPEINSGHVRIIDVPLTAVSLFQRRFRPTYLERLDPGELESLAHLVEVDQDCSISSADKIVWRTLGALRLGERGLSLEEILSRIGQSQRLAEPFTKRYRDKWTRTGFDEGLRGEATR